MIGDNDLRESDEPTLTRLLEAHPHSIRAHIGIADLHARAGREDLATYFYRAAVELAQFQEVRADALGELERARKVLSGLQARAHSQREARLAQRGLPEERWSPRLREALEVAAGRRKHYRQQPTAFTYPGLPAVQFFDPSQFAWVSEIEAATAAIREELVSLLETNAGDFRGYVQHNTVAPEANRALLGTKDWSILPLCENGWLVPRVVERCPRTWEAVLQAPLPRISGWGPTVVFSLLKAGARIAPHTGMFNTRLICHLPLIVPPGCRFRVGNEVREWEEGKLLILDDTIEHEAWNDSEQDRIVLIFDIWRPELSEQERFELTALFSD
jgi:aspartyl/asparaginyl beta-hydroxylase (cupin superfamily)